MSLGAFYRASVRRALELPPVWAGRGRFGKASAGKVAAEQPELRGTAAPAHGGGKIDLRSAPSGMELAAAAWGRK